MAESFVENDRLRADMEVAVQRVYTERLTELAELADKATSISDYEIGYMRLSRRTKLFDRVMNPILDLLRNANKATPTRRSA